LRILVALAVMLVVFGAVAFVTTISFGP